MYIMLHDIIYNKCVYLIPKKIKHTSNLYPGRLTRILTKKFLFLIQSIPMKDGQVTHSCNLEMWRSPYHTLLFTPAVSSHPQRKLLHRRRPHWRNCRINRSFRCLSLSGNNKSCLSLSGNNKTFASIANWRCFAVCRSTSP